MTGDPDRSCPPWCQQLPGHLQLDVGGPGDYHTAEIAAIDLPALPGLRGPATSPFRVLVEQYVTPQEIHPPLVLIGDPDGVAYASFTLMETRMLAAAIHQAAVTATTSGEQEQTTPHLADPADGDHGCDEHR